jgi:hypothetical protein
LIPHWSCPNPTTQYLCHSVIVTQCPVYCSWCIFWPQSSAGRTRKPSSMPTLILPRAAENFTKLLGVIQLHSCF